MRTCSMTMIEKSPYLVAVLSIQREDWSRNVEAKIHKESSEKIPKVSSVSGKDGHSPLSVKFQFGSSDSLSSEKRQSNEK